MKFNRYPNSTVFDLSIGGERPAMAICAPWQDGHWLYRMIVRRESRRRGYGTELMRQIITATSEPLYLEAIPHDDAPLSIEQLTDWYRRLGFVDFGTIDGRKVLVHKHPLPPKPRALKRMLTRGMQDPDGVAIQITYLALSGERTERTISPIRYVGKHTVLALCLSRAEPRQFILKRITAAKLIPASDVLMPASLVVS